MEKTDQYISEEELEKALTEVLGEAEAKEFLEKAKKAEDEDIDEKPEAEEEKEEDDDVEKAYGKCKAEYDELTKTMSEKEKKMNELRDKMNGGVKKSEDDEDLRKSITEEISGTFKGEMEILKSENDELRKSIEDLQKSVEGFLGQPQGRKAVVRESQVLEKGEGDEGRDQWSLSGNKANIKKSIENMIEKSDDSGDITRLENELILMENGGYPSVSTLQEISKSENVDIIK